MNSDELNKKKILSDIVKKLDIIENSRTFEQRIVAGRVTPTPSFYVKPPKEVVVKPKKEDEK